jgi:DNA (cytosine-5)-methyltransferase 1
MKFDIFQGFRDRQITKENGKYRVLKSCNVGSNEVLGVEKRGAKIFIKL